MNFHEEMYSKSSIFLFSRLIFGLILFGIGLALVVLGNFGVSPWEVFHQGVSRRTPLSIGTTIIFVGVIILFFLSLLKEPMGIGTIANVLIIGLVVDLTLNIFNEITNTFPRIIATLLGPILVAVGSGFYIGTRLGPGPRDGLMTGLQSVSNLPIAWVRSGIELSVVLIGWLLGGVVGIGTLLFAFGIGPSVAASIQALTRLLIKSKN